MRRTAFPRLYVPPEEVPEVAPKLPPVPTCFCGRRSAFGPVTVYSVSETREVVSDKDWRGEEAAALARDLLWDLSLTHDDPEECEAFAREVLALLPADGWELPRQDVRDWHRRWRARVEESRWAFPPVFDPDNELPGPEDEARMLELVKRLGRGGT